MALATSSVTPYKCNTCSYIIMTIIEESTTAVNITSVLCTHLPSDSEKGLKISQPNRHQ